MPDSTIVRLHAHAEVNPKDWNVFQQMLLEVGSIVQMEGKENVIMQQTYHKTKSYDCLIIEAYKNEEAFLSHLEQIKPLSGKFKFDWKIKRLELSGAFSQATVNALRETNVESEFSFYEVLL